ncbi:MAG: hypothetical protein DME60_08385 [Verrucomicrobia bacterium]|nr:MAG: hypothetical protein DME60_08385 [Verrucomicrobiota bacterium]
MHAIRTPITATNGAAICNHSARVTRSPPINVWPDIENREHDRQVHSDRSKTGKPNENSNQERNFAIHRKQRFVTALSDRRKQSAVDLIEREWFDRFENTIVRDCSGQAKGLGIFVAEPFRWRIEMQHVVLARRGKAADCFFP